MIKPKHVAIIMDGNGRWGLKKNKTRNYGHLQGIKTVEDIIKASIKKKLKFLTLYTFSTENWKRPKNEIFFLFKILENYIDKELKNLNKENIKIKILGDHNKIPRKLVDKLKYTELLTKKNKRLQINVALNYGSRNEIIRAINKIKKKKYKISEKLINQNLYTKNIPDPDILIRTGNTNRLSNFLLWQLQYSEIFFVKKLWPDFKQIDFYKVLNKYDKIQRKFGAI
ncbi:polyprenyl diphosphate synthase [Candidatus Pelagibacter sp. RS40]|uniref:polyprenyl diphosphate synthase n=1 Tax=Candidatus Pelagibacter sp. RS40 TaxID=1977865 RepID=UPI000A15A3A2|nr:polyprenyl diphosphate synthase [Candidatus Pelagibacter sp. RS40]ARJ48505.1 di-trans,poly-cis-decaprenylcistransferase [Candidatus Pelagibacter sp. RS40]